MIDKQYDSLYEQKQQKRITLPKQLTSEIPLNPKDPQQKFFRVSERATESKETMIKLGWKVADITRQKVDLTLFCLALLQAELSAPFCFFATNRTEQGGKEIKSVWIEWHILLSGASKDDNIQKNMLQLSIYRFCVKDVLPRLSGFIRWNLDWPRMCQEQFTDTKAIAQFETGVKVPLSVLFKKFRVGKTYID